MFTGEGEKTKVGVAWLLARAAEGGGRELDKTRPLNVGGGGALCYGMIRLGRNCTRNFFFVRARLTTCVILLDTRWLYRTVLYYHIPAGRVVPVVPHL